jgi:hypothetical protein
MLPAAPDFFIDRCVPFAGQAHLRQGRLQRVGHASVTACTRIMHCRPNLHASCCTCLCITSVLLVCHEVLVCTSPPTAPAPHTAPANQQVLNYVYQDLKFLLPAAVRKTSNIHRAYSYLQLAQAPQLVAVKWLLRTAEAAEAQAAAAAGPAALRPASSSKGGSASNGHTANSSPAATAVQAMLQDMLPELMSVPDALEDVALEFVRRGVKPSCQQLVDAARACVAGVEVWSHAMRACAVPGMPTELPLAVELVCSQQELSEVS